jgi:hypothetical protein
MTDAQKDELIHEALTTWRCLPSALPVRRLRDRAAPSRPRGGVQAGVGA